MAQVSVYVQEHAEWDWEMGVGENSWVAAGVEEGLADRGAGVVVGVGYAQGVAVSPRRDLVVEVHEGVDISALQ
ncbi:MAG: hypothetical protein M3Y89_15000 [Actinomycetota bacterium]|nr:hypothetical protein [Actinomycetota bacterium]